MNYLRSLVAAWSGHNRAVQLFLYADIFFAVYIGISSLLANFHLLALGYTANDIGTFQATSALVTACAAIPVGLLADRLGPRRFYLAGSYGLGLAALALPWLTGYWAILAAFAVTGLFSTLMFTTEFPLMAGEVDPGRRGSLFSLFFLNFFLFNAASTLLAGRLADWLPAGPSTAYQLPLSLAGVAAVAGAAIRQWMPLRPWTPSPAAAAGGGPDPAGRPRRRWPTLGQALDRLHPAVLPMAGIAVLMGGTSALGSHFSNVIVKERFALPDAAVAPLLTVSTTMAALGNLLVPAIERRLGQARGIAYTLVALVPVQLASAYAGSLWPFMAAFWVRNLLLTLQHPQTSAFTMSIVPPHNRSAMSSFSMVGSTIGLAVGDRIYGPLLAAHAYAATFVVAASFGAAAAGLFWLWVVRRPPQIYAE